MPKFRQHNTRSAVLTAEAVIEMRRLYHQEHWSQGRLANHFDVSVIHVGRIVRNESWRHLPTMEEPDAIKLSHAETIPMPQESIDKLMKELSLLTPEEPKTDIYEEYINKGKDK